MNKLALHQPVLLTEVMSACGDIHGQIAIDATFGRGGHTKELLKKVGPAGLVIALDHDPEAIAYGQEVFTDCPQLSLHQGTFINLTTIVDEILKTKANLLPIGAILFDLGVSSPQIDTPQRGFSYHQNGPLDMRMNPANLTCAADLVNQLTEKQLADIIYKYGDERFSRRIARAIVGARVNKQITDTATLANIIRHNVPEKNPRLREDCVVRTFQALRIAVNDELEAIKSGLSGAVSLLSNGGRLLVIAFHSLEDRLVKNFINDRHSTCLCPPSFPVCCCQQVPTLKKITKKPIRPSPPELEINPRARSARFRVAEKC